MPASTMPAFTMPAFSMPTLSMDPGWPPFHPSPSRPAFAAPPGAVDAHCHVFGSGEEFPYAAQCRYTPCDASAAQLFALRQRLSSARSVVVQPPATAATTELWRGRYETPVARRGEWPR